MQVVGGLCIMVWTVVMTGATFLFIKYTVGVQVSEEVEMDGLDASEHGLPHQIEMPPAPPIVPIVMPPPMPAAADDKDAVPDLGSV